MLLVRKIVRICTGCPIRKSAYKMKTNFFRETAPSGQPRRQAPKFAHVHRVVHVHHVHHRTTAPPHLRNRAQRIFLDTETIDCTKHRIELYAAICTYPARYFHKRMSKLRVEVWNNARYMQPRLPQTQHFIFLISALLLFLLFLL